MLYLLDTDTCAFIARHKHPKVTSRFRGHVAGDLAMSVVTYGELRVGAEKSDRYPATLNALEVFTQMVLVVPMEIEVARFYSRVYRRRGDCSRSLRTTAAGTTMLPAPIGDVVTP